MGLWGCWARSWEAGCCWMGHREIGGHWWDLGIGECSWTWTPEEERMLLNREFGRFGDAPGWEQHRAWSAAALGSSGLSISATNGPTTPCPTDTLLAAEEESGSFYILLTVTPVVLMVLISCLAVFVFFYNKKR